MKLIWNGHSCFTLVSEAGTVAVDPYRDEVVPGYGILRLTVDAVYCSHEHRDHGATEVVTLSGRPCGVAVEALHTFHDPEQGALRGANTIHIFSAEGLRVAHLGDLGCKPEPEQMEKLKNLDALMIPVGGYYTIDAAEAKALVDELKPRVIIPMHYRNGNLGFDVIGTVEEFLKLGGHAVRYQGNTLELTSHTPAQIAVLTYQG